MPIQSGFEILRIKDDPRLDNSRSELQRLKLSDVKNFNRVATPLDTATCEEAESLFTRLYFILTERMTKPHISLNSKPDINIDYDIY